MSANLAWVCSANIDTAHRRALNSLSVFQILILESQAFSRSYDLDLAPPPPPPPPVRMFDRRPIGSEGRVGEKEVARSRIIRPQERLVLYKSLNTPLPYQLLHVNIRNTFFSLQYSTLLHLPPLRFHCVDGCWDRTQDRCNGCMGMQSDALTTRLDLISTGITVPAVRLSYTLPPL